ncbi:U-box domain-containing protein 9 [Olea europaea var. sylvestris]|uniref:U-box domain-containing protein 9 n=1 Tax=Olea europaea var. sylvestris TaxID=158386 RepID=UPI000C1CEF33|nr:U-box domain-containing protein 9 [Olea europaea var. sylvestris]
MAKSGVLEGGPGLVAKTMELKRELHKLVKVIVDDEDVNLEAIDKAQQMLSALKELKMNKYPSLYFHNNSRREVVSGAVPEEFKCPLSKELMRDPVIVATGQTYDRSFIQKWLKSGNRTCPRTQQVLSHTILTPNHLIKEMISQWCKNHGIRLSDSAQYLDEDALTRDDRDQFLSLLEKMSSTLSDQKEAAREMRLLTKRMPSFRALFGESCSAIPQLLSPLSQSKSQNEVQPDLHEDIITTLLNLSIHDNNKKLVAETPMVIPLLMDALRSGTIGTRSNAAAALFTLSALDSNKELIGKSGALKPLIDLLEEGHLLAVKDVASAIFNLCILHENKLRAVRDGAVRVILKKIMNRMHVDELLSILAMLSTSQTAVEQMGELGGVECLLSIIRETSCARNKENCIAILFTICHSDRSKWKQVRDEENTYGTISKLAENGSSRAKRKASGILERLNRAINLTHTA